MRILVLFLSILICIKTVYYGLFEYKYNNNKIGAIIVFILGAISLIAPNVAMSL